MSEQTSRITHALMRVAADLGHGGPLSEYKIDSGEGGYGVTLAISKPFPSPGQNRFRSPSMTETLAKGRREVEEFLEKLSAEFNVFRLADLEPKYPFLHPTFYSFCFQDSAGEGHAFEYRIECSSHLDERYEALVREFESFFESRRVFDKFFESLRG
ncbi:MAG TPA: hypothetical protein VD968_14510 [Pyrinomonadaceae bacterium]|nr:hypothetical protein [Pyrinomonadaceae bacterium]